MLPSLRQTSLSYSESGIKDAVFSRDVHLLVAFFWRWEHREDVFLKEDIRLNAMNS